MPLDLYTPFRQVISQTTAMLPRIEQGNLLERCLMRNLSLAVGLDRRATAEAVGEQLGRLISDLANPSALSAQRLQEIGRSAKYVTAALEMAEAGVISVPGVEMQFRCGDIVFPNGRTLLQVENHYESDCPEDRSFLFDCGTGGLVTIPRYALRSRGVPLFTAEGRMLIPFQIDNRFGWGVVELPSPYTPRGHSFVFEGREISQFYGLYPLSNGNIAAFVRLRTDNPRVYDNQLIDLAANELIAFEDPNAYIAGPLVYGAAGELFAPLRFKGAQEEKVVPFCGDTYQVKDLTGMQIADVVTRKILTAGIHTSTPWVDDDGSVTVQVWHRAPRQDQQDEGYPVTQTLAEARVNSIEPYNQDNFPIGACYVARDRQPHLSLVHAKPQWLALPQAPSPQAPLALDFRDGQWVVTLDGTTQHMLRGKGEFLPAPDAELGPGSIKYFFTKAGDQVAQFCRSSQRTRGNEYDFFDLLTGNELMIEGSRVTAMSKPQELPDGREIWPMNVEGRGYLVLDPRTKNLTGIPGINIAYIGGDGVLVDGDNFYVKVCCKEEFDQRFLKV